MFYCVKNNDRVLGEKNSHYKWSNWIVVFIFLGERVFKNLDLTHLPSRLKTRKHNHYSINNNNIASIIFGITHRYSI